MALPFPDDPMLQGLYAPVFVEGESGKLPVEGEVPRELNGTLYRNGPNPQFAPRGLYHWFAGDGMVHAFHIENGEVTYRNRYVRTPKFELERAAGRALFGAFGNPAFSDPSTVGKDFGVANTHIVYHGGKLLALEESHLPFELEPGNLASRRYHTFGGALPLTLEGRFTAHPKFDPINGDMVGYSYSGSGLFGTRMSLIVVDRSGKLVRRDIFDAPYCAFVHDFLLTQKHVIFPILPLSGSMERARSGKSPYAWDPQKPALLAVVGRDAAIDTMRWFEVEPCFVFHVFNAWTSDQKILCDVIKYDRAPLFPDVDGNPADTDPTAGRPVRWSIDLSDNTNRIQETPLSDVTGEFPRCDERFGTLAYRYGYYAISRPQTRSKQPVFTALGRLDLEKGREQTFDVPVGDGFSEPVFAARSNTADEGDGFLLSVQYRGAENRSDLVVFDAQGIARGPIARVTLSHRVPAGFHGSWVSAS
jgi:carotenoid cleavage dioxygenase-like enzyme